jgi:hypothetical protein
LNLTELTADTLFLSNTVTTQYPQAAITRNLNYYYDEVVTEIWKTENSWKFDKGHDTLPIATTDLVEDQRDYQLPTEARKIERVEVLDSNDKWIVLTPIVPEDAPAESDTTGTPKEYYIKGRSIYLYPLPRESKTQGLSIYLSRSVDALVETTDEPKVDREFHRYLSVGAALDWYFAKGNVTKSREMERKLEILKRAIKEFYSTRNTDYKSRMKPRLQSYN